MAAFAAILPIILLSLTDDAAGAVEIGRFVQGPFCFNERPGVDHNVNQATRNITSSCVKATNSEALFYLFTRRNTRKPEFLHYSGGRLSPNTYFNPNHKTEIFIHGFSDGPCRTAHYREIKDQLLCRGDYNVILVDITIYHLPDYYNGMENVNITADKIACVLKNILAQQNVSKESVHIVGHSLGVQIAGAVGRRVPGLGRITGLDPSGPGYGQGSGREDLSKNDANLVDVIHTGGTPNHCFFFFSSLDPQGHIDIYVNGGTFQPSCVPYMIESYLKYDIFYATFSLLPQGCTHLHVLQYYKDSINPCKCQYVAVECDSYEDFKSGKCKKECSSRDGSNCVVMGFELEEFYYPKDGASRKYYMDSAFTCPYCNNGKVQLNNYFEKTNPNYQSRCCSNSSNGLVSPLKIGFI